METALRVFREAGRDLVDPGGPAGGPGVAAYAAELTVLLCEFKDGSTATWPRGVRWPWTGGLPLHAGGADPLNEAHRPGGVAVLRSRPVPGRAGEGPLTGPAYREALATSRRLGGAEGIDAVMKATHLDALVAPTACPPRRSTWSTATTRPSAAQPPAAQAGYPLVTVPAGFVFGLPVSLSFIGRRFGDARLIALAHAFEQATLVRVPPRFHPTMPLS